jgi:DNA-binding Lrp family transcriptional regulator
MSDKRSSSAASAHQTSTGVLAHGGLPGRTVPALDDVDRAMLAELAADGRLAVRALAEKLHISRTNAYARLERLMVTVEQTSWRTMATDLHEIPYVDHVALVGGDFDILLLVRTPDNSTLRDVVLERLQALEGVRSTRTWLIFEELPGSVLS